MSGGSNDWFEVSESCSPRGERHVHLMLEVMSVALTQQIIFAWLCPWSMAVCVNSLLRIFESHTKKATKHQTNSSLLFLLFLCAVVVGSSKFHPKY